MRYTTSLSPTGQRSARGTCACVHAATSGAWLHATRPWSSTLHGIPGIYVGTAFRFQSGKRRFICVSEHQETRSPLLSFQWLRLLMLNGCDLFRPNLGGDERIQQLADTAHIRHGFCYDQARC